MIFLVGLYSIEYYNIKIYYLNYHTSCIAMEIENSNFFLPYKRFMIFSNSTVENIVRRCRFVRILYPVVITVAILYILLLIP